MTGTVIKSDISKSESYNIRMIDIERIMPNRAQPRTIFDNESLSALSESIKTHGIIQPLTVRPYPDKSNLSNFQYELIAGERRLRASKLAGLKKVPCIVTESDTRTSAALAIIENLHRSDLNVFEEATAIAALIEIYKLTQEEAAQKLSMTQAAVANKLRLLKLTAKEKEEMSDLFEYSLDNQENNSDIPEQKEELEQEDKYTKLLSLISASGEDVDELIRAMQLPTEEVLMTIVELELDNKIIRLPGNKVAKI